MKSSLGAHRTISALESSEQFFEFVRALFMISLALSFSPVRQDRNVAEFIQQLSMELYLHLCNHNKLQRVTRLSHSSKSVKLMNASLTVLGLPGLDGVHVEEARTISISDDSHRLDKHEVPEHDKYFDNQDVKTNKSGASASQISDLHCVANQQFPHTEVGHKSIDAPCNQTEDRGKQEGQLKMNLKDQKTFRGWTYNFGHKTCVDSIMCEGRKNNRTFPLTDERNPLDPKKQWQTYKHKCVGLPVDPEFFASPAPSSERIKLLSTEISAPNESSQPLVNLSLPYIKLTVEERTGPAKSANLVNREKTTIFSTDSLECSERMPLHPHDLAHQPMKRKCNDDNSKEHVNEDAQRFAPLVDLAKTTMSDVLEASVGESISTTDAIEYINSWIPPQTEASEEESIIRSKYLGIRPTYII